jgi:hypothetical protein
MIWIAMADAITHAGFFHDQDVRMVLETPNYERLFSISSSCAVPGPKLGAISTKDLSKCPVQQLPNKTSLGFTAVSIGSVRSGLLDKNGCTRRMHTMFNVRGMVFVRIRMVFVPRASELIHADDFYSWMDPKKLPIPIAAHKAQLQQIVTI